MRRVRARAGLLVILIAAGLVLLVALLASGSADAGQRDWSGSPNSAWYASQKLTPQTKKIYGLSWGSCCDHGDVCQECVVYRAQDRPPWRDGWFYRRRGKISRLPPHIVEYVPWTPTGRPVLFVAPSTAGKIKRGDPVCLKVPGGGA